MALTQQVKSELATIKVVKPDARRAEVAAMLRFAGGLHLVSGHIVIEAEFDTGAGARRLRTALRELYGFDSELLVINSSGIKRGTRYVVRLVRDGESLSRQVGLIDAHGRPVRGLPSQIIGGGVASRSWRDGSKGAIPVGAHLHGRPDALGTGDSISDPMPSAQATRSATRRPCRP